jgi:hypothetical protein
MMFQRDNHYVPCMYLKHFEVSPGRVLAYRILVAHPRVPLWKETAIRGIAYHAHLYTRIVSGIQTDEIEKWLNTEFETPAEDALNKATCDSRLSPTDWHNLIRFLAAQDVRTPARLSENIERWKETLPAMLDDTLREAVNKLEEVKKSGESINIAKTANSEYIPLRVTPEIKPGQEFGELKAEVIVGRALWLFSMKHTLANTAKVLHDHHWSMLKAPDGLTWITSDDPVIRLNYYGDGKYDFRGGWGNPGTEIFLPLDPRHLLYTKVGERPQRWVTVVSREIAEMIRGFIAQHAHRFIFAASSDSEVPKMRPRIVDAVRLRDERQQWLKWNSLTQLTDRLWKDTKADRRELGWRKNANTMSFALTSNRGQEAIRFGVLENARFFLRTS